MPLMANAMTIDSQKIYTTSPVESVALVPTNAIVSVSEPAKARSDVITAVGIATSSEVASLILETFPEAPRMLQVAIAESDLVTTAKNPKSSATGIFQVLNGTRDAYHCGDQTIAEESIKCARKIYDAEGYKPWRSSGNW
jgi:hypothetical protein